MCLSPFHMSRADVASKDVKTTGRLRDERSGTSIVTPTSHRTLSYVRHSHGEASGGHGVLHMMCTQGSLDRDSSSEYVGPDARLCTA